jgi:thymidylate synthase
MRFYQTFPEALNELKRELKEMGIRIHTQSYQNKDIKNDPQMGTLELQNYQYLVTDAQSDQIPIKNLQWATEDFLERVSQKPLNPGEAWKYRRETWEQFLKPNGRFDYTYSERMADPIRTTLEALKKDLYTRRAFLPVFDRQMDNQSDFNCRIPCSLGYWFYFRQDKLNITYLQRSADFSEHFNYDIWMANTLNSYIAYQLNVTPGSFSHWVGSLHIFERDVKGVF